MLYDYGLFIKRLPMSWLRYITAIPAIHNACWRLNRRIVKQHYTTVCTHQSLGCVQSSSLFRISPRTTPFQWPIMQRYISTLKRRVFKIKKHKKKKRKKKLSRLSIIPWRPPSEEKKITYQMPYKMRRIVKERRRRNKGNRTLRVPRQR